MENNMNPDELNKLLKIASEGFLANSVVPIIYDHGHELGIDQIGTGLFYEYEENIYLITAKHVIDDSEIDGFDFINIGIPSSHRGPNVFTLGRVNIYRTEKLDEVDADVILIEILDSDVVKFIKSGWRILNKSNTKAISDEENFVVCGYPAKYLKSKRGLLNGTLIVVYTHRLDGTPEGAKLPVCQGIDIFFNYDLVAVGGDGEEIATPPLEGISGSAIWECRSSNEGLRWTPEDNL